MYPAQNLELPHTVHPQLKSMNYFLVIIDIYDNNSKAEIVAP